MGQTYIFASTQDLISGILIDKMAIQNPESPSLSIRNILEVILLDILEVAVSVYLEFADCELVCYDDSVWVSLES